MSSFANYAVIERPDLGLQAIVVSSDAWGCRLLIENGRFDCEYVNYSWSALLLWRVVG